MGGQNHQPCNRPGTNYLKLSTIMSLEVSRARIAIERANVELESLLLNEIGEGSYGSADTLYLQLLGSLTKSQNDLQALRSTVGELRADMQAHQFEDLPTLQTVNLEALGSDLQAKGMIEASAWKRTCAIMSRRGFYGMLDHFDEESRDLEQRTEALRLSIQVAEKAVDEGALNKVLEENRHGNFKREFAQLYTAWHAFQQLFLASSMLSTELWYRFTEVGSLLDESVTHAAAVNASAA